MKIKMIFGKNILIIGFLLLFTACASTPDSAAPEKISCDFLPEQIQPIWINNGGQIPGYYVGVGTANVRTDQSGALSLAKQNARGDLASSISVHVRKSLTQHIRNHINNDAELTSKQSESMTRSITDVSLNKVSGAGQWFNKKACQVWVRVKVDNATVEKIQNQKSNEQRLAQAEKLFGKTDDGHRGLDDKTHDMEMAMKLIDETDFNHLPMHSRGMFEGRYKKRLGDLYKQAGSRATLVYIDVDSTVSDDVRVELTNRFTDAVKDGWSKASLVCQSSASCLQTARRERAKQLIYVIASSRVNSGEMGGLLGELSLTVKLFDVISGRGLIAPMKVSDRVLSFDESAIEWRLAINRIFEQKSLNAVFDQLGKN